MFRRAWSFSRFPRLRRCRPRILRCLRLHVDPRQWVLKGLQELVLPYLASLSRLERWPPLPLFRMWWARRVTWDRPATGASWLDRIRLRPSSTVGRSFCPVPHRAPPSRHRKRPKLRGLHSSCPSMAAMIRSPAPSPTRVASDQWMAGHTRRRSRRLSCWKKRLGSSTCLCLRRVRL